MKELKKSNNTGHKVGDASDSDKDDRLKEFEKEHYKYVEDKGDPNKI